MKNCTISTKQTINYYLSYKNTKNKCQFQVILPFKNLRNLSTFDIVKDQSPRHFLHVWGLVLNVILKPLPIGTVKQSFPMS